MSERAETGTQIYVSIDIETDGPVPGDYSMLSLSLNSSQMLSKNSAAAETIFHLFIGTPSNS